MVTRIAVALAGALALAPAAHAQEAPCTKTWTGPAAGSWGTAANWSPAGVPATTDVVCAAEGSDITVNAAANVRAIRSAGTVDSNSSITLNDAGQASSITIYEHGTDLTGPGDVTIGTLTWGTGFMSGEGTTTVSGHSTLTGGGNLRTGRTLITRGTGTWSGNRSATGPVRWVNSAVVTTPGGSFSGTAVDTGTEILRPVFHNEPGGVVTKTGASNFTLSLSVDNDGTLERAPDATANFYLGEFTGESSGTFRRVDLTPDNARPLQLGGGVLLDGVEVTGGVVLIPPGETLEVNDLAIAGGTLAGEGTVVLGGHTTAYFGRLGSEGTLLFQPADGTMTWTHAHGIGARRFDQAGLVTVEETGLGRPETTWARRLVWENTGVVRLQAGLFPTFAGDEGARFVNRGLLVKETSGSFTFRPRLVNDGVLELIAGRLTATRLEQTTDGTLRTELRGGTAGTLFGALTATALRHQGRFEAVLGGGYVPAPGTRHQVITSSDRSGAFASTSLAGLMLDESQPTNIALVAPAARPAAPDAAIAPAPVGLAIAVLRAADDRALLRSRRLLVMRPLVNDQMPAGTRLRVISHSRGLRVQRRGRTLRIRRTRAARGALRVRYQLVAADGRRSRVATVRLRVAR